MLGIEKLSCKNGFLLVFVRVKRSDSLLRGAEFLIGKTSFFESVQFSVPRKKKGSAVADSQVLGSNRNTLRDNRLHLLIQVLEVKRHTVSEDVHDSFPEDSGRKKMESELAVFIDYGMAGISAALVPNDIVISLGQKIDHTAFAFVAPVDSYNCTVTHRIRFSNGYRFPYQPRI